MTKSRLQHLSHDWDRHGNLRIYVRLPGKPKVRIKETFEDENGCITEEFMAAYRLVVSGNAPDAPKPKKKVERSFSWLVDKYYKTSEWSSFAPETQKMEESSSRQLFETAGDLPFELYRQEDLKKSRDKRKDTPAAADNFVKVIRRLFNWAIEQKITTIANPACKVQRFTSQGAITPGPPLNVKNIEPAIQSVLPRVSLRNSARPGCETVRRCSVRSSARRPWDAHLHCMEKPKSLSCGSYGEDTTRVARDIRLY